VLVMPVDHLRDVTEAPIRSGHILERAARYAEMVGPSQIITSYGKAATQSVFHLNFHVIPRSEGDGLHPDWPWCRSPLDWGAHQMPS
jgi:histidine triad (HIT) family protein